VYELRFLKPAENYFKKIREKGLRRAYRTAQERLSADPYIGESKSGDLAGIYCYDVYYDGTNYEIAYRIYEEEGKIVVIILAGTRENFYRELKRYMRG